ncbi:MAG: N-acetyl sugar amidotransferase, partial [Bacteroidales bacterium]
MDNSSDSTIVFNDNRFCNYCSQALINKDIVYFPNENGREKMDALISQLKKEGQGKQYDCMMGISGGLDSSYLAYLGYKMGLRILAIHIDDGFDTALATDNINKLCSACNIELITIKPDAEQYNDITRAFFLAEVPNVAIPQDNILFAYLYKYAKKYKVKTFLSGGNFALESVLKSTEKVNAFDMVHIRDINKKYGQKPMDKLVFMTNYQKITDRYLHKIKSVRPLNYINYNKQQAISELSKFCDFNYYEYKHCENRLTKVIQLHWLIKKFNDDKRTSHLSSLIVSGQMTREEALVQLNCLPYDEKTLEDDIKFVLSKLGLSRKEYDKLIDSKGKKHADYKLSIAYKIANTYLKKLI